MAHHTDYLLAKRILKGDVQAYEQLITANQDALFTLIIKMVQDHDIAADLAQEVFIKAYEKLNLYNGKSRFGTWLYQMGYRHTLDFLRKKKPDNASLLPGQDWAEEEELENDTEWVTDALQSLSEMDRALLHFYYFENYSVKEIGEIIGKSESAVKVGLKRSRDRFKSISMKQYTEQVNDYKNL